MCCKHDHIIRRSIAGKKYKTRTDGMRKKRGKQMKSTFKRIGAILLCIALVMSFASCGKKNAEEETTTTEETITEVTTEVTTEEPTTEPTTAAPQTEPTKAKKQPSDSKKKQNTSDHKKNNQNAAKPASASTQKSASGNPLPQKKHKPQAKPNAVQPIFTEINPGQVYEGSQSEGLCDVFEGEVVLDIDGLFPYRHMDKIRGCQVQMIYVYYPDGDVCIFAEISNLDGIYKSCVESLAHTASMDGTEVTPELQKEFEAAAQNFTDALKKAFPSSQTLKYNVSGQTINYSDGSSDRFKVYQCGLVLTDEYGSIYLARFKYKV